MALTRLSGELQPIRVPFSRWREKVPKADEGGTSEDNFVLPSATLTRGAARLDLSRQRER